MALSVAEKLEWLRRSSMERADDDALADPLWRLANLYSVIDRHGKLVPFVPTAEQIEVVMAIHARGWRRLIIPKARQLGMSTVLILICLDSMLFTEGFSAALVDKKGDDAAKKMREKAVVAWDNLPAEMRARYEVTEQTGERLGVRIKGTSEAVSRYEVGTSFRGGTVQFLHISEWGWIQANDPARSKEILTGSLPAAEKGIIVVETTWEGGRAGDVWPLVEEALNTPENQQGPDTWRLLFFSWFTCPEYATPHGYCDPASAEYLDSKERELGIRFTREQRHWYAGVNRKFKRLVRQEYPTTLDECWHSPVSGAIYGEEIDRLRSLGRVGKAFEFVRSLPLFTSWDLGISDYTSLWLIQPHGTELLWLDWHEAEGQPASYYADVVLRWEREYKAITRHFIPHDAGRREIGSGFSYVETLAKLTLNNVTVVPQTQDVWWGVSQLRELLARSTFHARCEQSRKTLDGKERLSGLGCLEAYRKATETGASGILREAPVHDHASHSADAARTFAEAMARGLVPTTEKLGRDTRSSPWSGHGHHRPRQRAKMGVGG